MATLESLKKSFLSSKVSFGLVDFHAPILAFLDKVAAQHRQLKLESEVWAKAMSIVERLLPDRGWYLTGREPAAWIVSLARHANANDWAAVDNAILSHVDKGPVKTDRFCDWLLLKGVPEFCVTRVRRFFVNHDAGNYEESTFLGLPLIDEIARALYGGKDFTTKRNKQPKPQIACKTQNSPQLSCFCERFVQTFGSIQEEVEMSRLSDDDYFSRSAILHGQMRRSLGKKDSAKTLMAILFLVYALRDEEEENLEQSSESECSENK